MLIHPEYLNVHTFVSVISSHTTQRALDTPPTENRTCLYREASKKYTPHQTHDSACVPQHNATQFVLAPETVGMVANKI